MECVLFRSGGQVVPLGKPLNSHMPDYRDVRTARIRVLSYTVLGRGAKGSVRWLSLKPVANSSVSSIPWIVWDQRALCSLAGIFCLLCLLAQFAPADL